ncbi:MAG: hypothetical protein M3O30_06305 [Planctomycetota bacterium]|nr:hypothetical protein [Planctomycetota bacterium]
MAPDNTTRPLLLPVTDLYNQVRAQIQHEDDLVAQRLNWFLSSQSFLFTAYAIVSTSSPVRMSSNEGIRTTLMTVIPLIAIIAGALIFIAIVAGAMVMRRLRVSFEPYEAHAQEHGLPPLQGFGYTRTMGFSAPMMLPLVFMAVWTMLIVRFG